MTPTPADRTTSARDTFLAIVVFVVLALVVSIAWEASGRQISDTALYQEYGERIASGKLPYRDFEFEYPPGILPFFALPALLTSSFSAFTLLFGFLMALVGAVGIAIVAMTRSALGRAPSETRRVLVALALSPLVLGALLLTRFDLVPVTLTAGGLLALLRRRDRLGGGLLGLGVAVKLYPAVIVPLAVAWTWRRRGAREAILVAAVAVSVAVAVYLPFFAIAPGGVARSIGHQLSRPLQIESLGAGILLVVHQLAETGLAWESSHGSQNLTGTAADVLAVLLFAVQIAVLVLVWVRFARGPADTDRLVRFSAAAVVAFIAFGKVLSPQFVLWPLLLVPLAGGVRLRVAGALYGLGCLLTAIWFPGWYWALVREFDPLMSFLVLFRDMALVALLIALATSGRPRPSEAVALATARPRNA